MLDRLTRRNFGRLLGVSAAATVLPSASATIPPTSPQGTRAFPADFLFGSATASYQVEGAVHEDGRGPSVWDTFSHTEGKTHNGDTGDVAEDFFHRFPEDIQLMRDLGLQTFRFSVSWSRIFPSGSGQPNQKGLDFYKRLTDALLAAGVQPFCTLYHWDLPQALQDQGGWQNRATAQAFADYAGYTAGALSDRVKRFMTLNEISTFVDLGYRVGNHAPGLKLEKAQVAQLRHHVLLAHGMAVQAIRAKGRPGTKVGLAENIACTCPVFASPEHVAAARTAMREQNTMYLGAILDGYYTESFLRELGANAPKFTAEEMKTISSPMDFVGINIYTPQYVRADASPKGYAMVPAPSSYPHMFSPWLQIGPEALYWGPKLAAEVWNIKEIFITENGASSEDQIAADGQVYDTDRTMYLRNCLTQLQRGIAEGVPVKGYFLWSLLDNYEWADGYEKRFGITFVDFKTQKRTPKLSAQFYRELIRTRTLV